MTKNNSHLINGSLTPNGAPQAFAALKAWLASPERDRLDIAPLTHLPSQAALQLLLAAQRELSHRDDGATCLSDDARRLCALAAGQAMSFPPLPHRSAT